MRYTEIKPAIQLTRFIECYWTLESDGSASASPQSEPILPDGCVELVLNFGSQFVEHYDGKVLRQPANFLVGQMTRPMLIAPTGSVCIIGIRFHPGGTFPFFRLPMHELTDSTVELGVVSDTLKRELFERAGQELSLLQRIAAVEASLTEWVRNSRQDSWILGLAAKIVSEAGLVSVDTLASNAGVSSRQLERRFLQEVGVAPKLLCRILRFQRIFRSIGENDGRWATVMGLSRTVAQGKTVEFEYLRIEQPADGIYYVAHPKGRCPGTDFKLTSLTGKEAVFENPEHDFPKRIIYRKSDDGSLVASIDGGPGIKTLLFSFRPMSK